MAAGKEISRKKTESSNAGLRKVSMRIDRVAKERPSHKEVLEFLKGVVTEQFKIKPGIKTHSVHMDEKLIKTKSAEGFPLVDKGDLKLDVASATNLFERLCNVLKRNTNVSADVEKIEQVISRKELNLDELFKKTAAKDAEYVAGLADRLNLKGEIISFLAENSLQPIFEAYADELKGHVDQETWQRGYCPICGSKPVMAELVGAERKKFLICSCCGYEWRFMRTKCPFCENEEPKGFKYFFTEKEGRAYRVETCQNCKKYIKTVDTEELGEEVIPSVEDMGTLYLDVLAKKEGYEREVHPLGFSIEDLE
ncbi:MAG: formate dehydrogenase accessory protein FdhE [Desulfobacterales bacterium]|nr:formate dehydrogenase accessory protein FdhE [Desulfobacterales bacterium]